MTQFDFKGRVIKSFAADATDPINAICVSPEDAYLAGCIKEKIYLWNCEAGVSYGKLEGHHANITCCFMNDELLASGSENGIVHLWKYKMLKRVARIGEYVYDYSMSCCYPIGFNIFRPLFRVIAAFPPILLLIYLWFKRGLHSIWICVIKVPKGHHVSAIVLTLTDVFVGVRRSRA